MDRPCIAIHRWPVCASRLDLEEGALVVAVDTPQTSIRDVARGLVRAVALNILGSILDSSANSLQLRCLSGQPPKVAGHDDIHISFSHEPGLSLLAIGRERPLGVDLLHCPSNPAWQADIPVLARDYLPPWVAEKITSLPLTERAAKFAAAWTRHEACLKALGRELTEWQVEFTQPLAGCQTFDLQLPAGYYGTLAKAG